MRVGLFTSPHLVSFRERIQVNRKLIEEEYVVRLVEELRPLLKEFPEAQHPTFFETVTVMALRYFAEQQCDLVIWETGMGGRLDATNIVTPLASVITNVQFDHQHEIGRVLLEGRLNSVVDLGVGMHGAAAFDRHPFRLELGAPGARGRRRVAEELA